MERRADILYPKMKKKTVDGAFTGAAANIVTDEIAGVKKGNPMSLDEAMEGVNPDYGKNEKYNFNCAGSTAVLIARIKGYDIEALPYLNNYDYKKFASYPNTAFIDPKTGTIPNFEDTNVKSPKDLNNWLNKNIKQGGMYILSYRPYNDSSENHTIVTFKNPKGALIYFDPQNKKFYDRNFPENIAYYKMTKNDKKFELSSPKVLRVDDKELNKKVFTIFSKKSKK